VLNPSKIAVSRTNGPVGRLDLDAVPPIDDIGDPSFYPDRLEVVPLAERLGMLEKQRRGRSLRANRARDKFVFAPACLGEGPEGKRIGTDVMDKR